MKSCGHVVPSPYIETNTAYCPDCWEQMQRLRNRDRNRELREIAGLMQHDDYDSQYENGGRQRGGWLH
jgi:hypothetical protein